MQTSCPLSCLQITELCMAAAAAGHILMNRTFLFTVHRSTARRVMGLPPSLSLPPQKSYCNMPILFGASPNFDHVTGEPRGQQLTRPREGEKEGWRALFVLMCVMSHCCPACGWNRCQLTGCCVLVVAAELQNWAKQWGPELQLFDFILGFWALSIEYLTPCDWVSPPKMRSD